MNKKKCPKCGSVKTKKNGQRNGVQLYKCTVCNHQFRGGSKVSIDELWEAYMNGKQTIHELASLYHVSPSSIKRRLRKITKIWQQPDLTGMSGFVHIDATYWGRSWGIILVLDNATNMPCPHNHIDCPCPKDCPRHGKCCECVAHHRAHGTRLPACLRGIDWQK